MWECVSHLALTFCGGRKWNPTMAEGCLLPSAQPTLMPMFWPNNFSEIPALSGITKPHNPLWIWFWHVWLNLEDCSDKSSQVEFCQIWAQKTWIWKIGHQSHIFHGLVCQTKQMERKFSICLNPMLLRFFISNLNKMMEALNVPWRLLFQMFHGGSSSVWEHGQCQWSVPLSPERYTSVRCHCNHSRWLQGYQWWLVPQCKRWIQWKSIGVCLCVPQIRSKYVAHPSFGLCSASCRSTPSKHRNRCRSRTFQALWT